MLSTRSTEKSKRKNSGNFDLPSELWTHIFDFTVDEDLLFQYALPTSMAESAWFKTVYGDWALRTPQEALNLIQRRNYATKKVCVHLVAIITLYIANLFIIAGDHGHMQELASPWI
jgi:hypothetical protein